MDQPLEQCLQVARGQFVTRRQSLGRNRRTSANATRHRQRRRWRERSVATVGSYHTSSDERPVEPNPFEPRALEVSRSPAMRADAFHRTYDELRYTRAPPNHKRFLPKLTSMTPDFAPIISVDRAWTVENRHSIVQRQPRPGHGSALQNPSATRSPTRSVLTPAPRGRGRPRIRLAMRPRDPSLPHLHSYTTEIASPRHAQNACKRWKSYALRQFGDDSPLRSAPPPPPCSAAARTSTSSRSTSCTSLTRRRSLDVPPATLLATIRSQPLRSSLALAFATIFSVSAAKPTTTVGRSVALLEISARMSGFSTRRSVGDAPSSFLIFCRATVPPRASRRPQLRRRTRQPAAPPRQRRAFRGRLDAHYSGPERIGKRDRAADQRHSAPAPTADCAIACPWRPEIGFRETDRIDGLVGRARRDDDMPPGERARGRLGAESFAAMRAQRFLDRLHDRRRLSHSPGAELAAGHRPGFRADEQDAVGAADVRRFGASPDAATSGLHRRRREHTFVGREQQRRREVVGEPLAIRARRLCGRGSDHDEVRRARQLDMADLALRRSG